MTTRWFGAPVQRVEDDRLLRGHGRFTDDINETGQRALECCFVRSAYAHARIRSIDASAAREMPAVVAVYTAADLPFGGLDLPLLIPHPNLTHGRTQRCLASEIVRYALPESSVAGIAPDVGGGFGPKMMLFYPDELLVPFAAMQLGRPVKWTEVRQEHFTAVNQERGQVHEVEVGFDGDGRVVALSDDFIHDGGAYTPYGIILPIITAAQVPGPYRVPNYRVRFRDVYTNATPTSPYRRAGRPHACFVMERTLDAIAAELKLDRIEVRRRNLILPDAFPYEVGA